MVQITFLIIISFQGIILGWLKRTDNCVGRKVQDKGQGDELFDQENAPTDCTA